MDSPDSRIIVFGRYPVPGRTKTRLIPALGGLGAAELQRRLTLQCLDKLAKAGLAPVTFCYCGASQSRVRRWLGGGIDLEAQSPGGLGLRMQKAMAQAFARGAHRVVLLGTDVPGMTAGLVRQALDLLADHDVVLGPTLDGGYWLVGARRPVPVFDGIDWSTSLVLDQTLDLARKYKLNVALLDPRLDLDTPADLDRWEGGKKLSRPYLSVIIPALNEAGRIEAAVGGVAGDETEVIVVDGGSRDETMALARRAGARVMSSPRGRAVQQNTGAALAGADVLLFLHADTRLPRDFLNQVFEVLMDARVVLGAFRFRTDFDHWGMRLIEKTAHARARLLSLPYGDQGFFLRREMFRKAGGFPEVAIAEDLLFARRLARMGHLALAPGQAVTSGRRWRDVGIGRATLVNYLIAGGCMLGVDPARLAPLYRLWTGKR
ncbi:MAG: TIGR04283 family arsenosugar biosynthesis glycosyltransferase [Desulfosarcinaceae bacterium]